MVIITFIVFFLQIGWLFFIIFCFTHFSFMCWAWFKTENNEKQPTNLKEKNNKSNNHHTRSVSIFKSIRLLLFKITIQGLCQSLKVSDYCCLTSNNHHTRSVSIFKSIRCDYCCLTSNNQLVVFHYFLF
jgi:hypothetical protein